MSIFILSFAFWTPELKTMLNSLNRSTKRVLDEEYRYIETNSTRLSTVTFWLNTLVSLSPNIRKMMFNVRIKNMGILELV